MAMVCSAKGNGISQYCLHKVTPGTLFLVSLTSVRRNLTPQEDALDSSHRPQSWWSHCRYMYVLVVRDTSRSDPSPLHSFELVLFPWLNCIHVVLWYMAQPLSIRMVRCQGGWWDSLGGFFEIIFSVTALRHTIPSIFD